MNTIKRVGSTEEKTFNCEYDLEFILKLRYTILAFT